MSVEIAIQYQGNLRCQATHLPSGSKILTDAPTDNHGRGQSFSPTDLTAAALGTCMLTVMAIAAEKDSIDITGATVHVTKEMDTTGPRRIAQLTVRFKIPKKLSPDQKQKLESAANSCPVCRSLSPEVKRPVTFEWA